jgi:NAD(P)H dehydrogenase (quinone)
MPTVNLAVIYYSTYGTNHAMAEVAAAAGRAAGAEVRLRKFRETAPQEVVDSQPPWKAQAEKTADIPEVTPADMEWADAYLFSVPTRFGGAPSQARAFIDTLGGLWSQGKLADKAVSAMTSAQNPHGGQETTLQSLYFTFMHWGAIIVPPGYTSQVIYASGGNPYGTSVTATESLNDAYRASITHQATRLVEIASKLKG